jgi:hypothetical protein
MRRRLVVQGALALPFGRIDAATENARTAIGPPLVAPASNGGRSQVNLNFLQSGGDYPFINCLKTAQSWAFFDKTGLPEPHALDENGYPLSISNGGVFTVFFVPPQAVRPGHYVVTWEGRGTVFLGMQNVRVSGSLTSVLGRGRYVFSTEATRFVVGIQKVGTPHVTDLKVFHRDDEDALAAGEVFGVRFKERLREANFGVLRFLNWQNGNTTNVTSWATRKPASYVYYSGDELRASLYAGRTSNHGSNFTAELAGFSLADKAVAIVKFTADSNGPCTLNVNGTGAIRILNEYSGELSAGSNSFVAGGSWRSLATLVYDQALNAWVKFGGDVAFGSCGIMSGCPPELMVRLCAELGAHPYFVAPALACDPLTDYMPELAAYCRSQGPAWMVPRFEGPNELWNVAPGFLQTGYALAKAQAYGWGPDPHNWYGKVMSVLGQGVSAAYAGDKRRFQILCGVQTATGATPAGTTASNARLSSDKYVAQSAPPQAPYTKSRAADWVTHIATAQYYSPADYGGAREAELAVAHAAASEDPQLQSRIANTYASSSEGTGGLYTLPKVKIMHRNWKAWAVQFGIAGMCGYEGGYSPDLGGGTSEVRALRAASKQAQCLYALTLDNYNGFLQLRDTRFVAEYPSCFQLSGRAPTDNVWSVLDDIYQTPEPPQWKAIVAFNTLGPGGETRLQPSVRGSSKAR